MMELTFALLMLGFPPNDGSPNAWTQFRGSDGTAVAVGKAALPIEIAPDKSIVWKVPLCEGHSSPILYGDRIFVTGVENEKLYTIALDRKTGKEVWRRAAPYKKLEKIHSIGSHAQSTSATDGKHVVSFFGSCGLFCYDFKGKQLWHVPMGPFKSEFGAAASPLLVDGRVILSQDFDSNSFIAAYDVKSGKRIWRTDRSEFPVGCASPVIWTVNGKKQIVQAGTLRVIGYDFETGKEVWTVRGLSRICNMTPTIGPDNQLYLCGWAAGADPGAIIVVPPFKAMLKKHDGNKNGTLEANEIPPGPFKNRYPQFDRDRSGSVDRKEWEGMRQIFATAKNRMIAIRPGGTGDITQSHVVWEHTKKLPYVPSPLIFNRLIFLVKNGGIVTTLDPKTGKSLKVGRVPGTGSYYASPVGGDGKVYMADQRGDVSVISATGQWKTLHSAPFNEDIFATPAIVDGRIYLRTAGHLYCFGVR